jgi:hypothetical protein
MMRLALLLPLATGALFAGFCAGNAQHRELGAHVHGRGTLDIAMEGTRVRMEFKAPGADISGFEHNANTREQRTAVEKAKKQLAAPQDLFQLPASAKCVVEDTQVAIERDADGDRAQGGAAPGAPTQGAQHKHGAAGDNEAGHSEYRAQYVFNCKFPSNIASIAFGYFRIFTGARALDVTLITTKGQMKFEVTRAQPRIDLGGLM